MRFEGTKAYVATDDLKVAVNAAITLERPLLVKGEPVTIRTPADAVQHDARLNRIVGPLHAGCSGTAQQHCRYAGCTANGRQPGCASGMARRLARL